MTQSINIIDKFNLKETHNYLHREIFEPISKAIFTKQ